jgi:dimeric dUTPase (all-alpha-NTP-PPase superfamily)
MNITHAIKENVKGDKLIAIFNRQKELMEKYHDIEKRSGLLQTEECPINLDDKRGQARIKDFAWRVTEEVGEALESFVYEHNELHFKEELIDGLHFLTELTILSGLNETEIIEGEEGKYLETLVNDGEDVWKYSSPTIDTLVTKFICHLGMMCNCLKNKPWKQSHMRTDKNNFYNLLKKVWKDYIVLLVYANMDAEAITEIYLKKSQVNKFRQRSNY